MNPSGGGPRNRYGSNIFQRTQLGIDWSGAADGEGGEGGEEPEDSPLLPGGFSGDLTEWLSIGADLRLAYIFTKPKFAAEPDQEAEHTSDFFLMQADVYTVGNFGRHVSVVFDIGAYSGFEAWFLVRAAADDSDFDLTLKAGHFLPSFGIREVNHELVTRAGIGLGPTDRDSGLEVYASAGPLSFSVSLVNGTFDDSIFDTRGTDHRSFEKALASRLGLRFSFFGALNGELGGSVYYNNNVDTPNPLFTGFLSESQGMAAGDGLDELRLGPFFTAGVGRFVYLAEVAYVRDDFFTAQPKRIAGYVSYQELDVLLFQGCEVGAIFEFMDPDLEATETSTLRGGGKLSLFLNPFVELEAIARYTASDIRLLDQSFDAVLFAHAFF